MKTKTNRKALKSACASRSFKRETERQTDMELLTGAFAFPVILTLTDGTEIETTPHELTEERLQLFLTDARSGKPYPVEAELGAIRATGTVMAGRELLSAEEISGYSPIALAVAEGWLDRLRGFLDGEAQGAYK